MGWSGYADDSRQKANDLAQRAKAGDQQALLQLKQATGQVPGYGWRPDHRNAAVDAWNSLGMGQPLGRIKNPHKGILGGIGSVLKFAAPIAGMAIPGLGTLGAMALGAGGSALGGAMHGDKFNLGKTLLAGGAAGAGQSLLRGGVGGLLHGGGGVGNALQAGPGLAGQAQGGGLLGKLGAMAGKVGVGNLAKGGLGLAGFLDARKQAGQATAFNNAKLDLYKGQLDTAQQDYASRDPLRKAMMARLGTMASGPMSGSSIYRPAA